uniref:Uncharacterized protein n=1 Tax=Anguilla anguilla TaxID=7936 RepID=A0A0E9X951_ANGAN
MHRRPERGAGGFW